jgi:hypothetical protein
MPTVLLDGERYACEASTWGELLTGIDQHAESRAAIVVEVRFDGIEEPAFREPAALDHRLDDFATVEVTTGPPESLLDRCIGEAVGAIGVLCAAATSVGEQYRMYDVDEANRGLVELADGLGTLVAIAGAATIATKDDTATEGRREALNGLAAELSGYFESLVSAQEAQDWITVADILQYDVEAALRRWEPALGAFVSTAAA